VLRVVHDDRKQPVREETPTGEVGYEYDEDGRLTRIRTGWGDAISYEYNADGRLSSLKDWDGQETRFEYTPLGAICVIHYGGGQLVEKREHGRLGLVTCATAFDSSDHVLGEQLYAYDACDRLVRSTDAWGPGAEDIEHRRFIYDAEGRLLAETDPFTERVRFEYDYDAKGNLIYDNGSQVLVGAMDEPIAHGGRELVYDGVGNAQRIPSRSGGLLECVWAGDGTLAEVRVGDVRVRFSYDALGRRLTKTVGRSTWRYGWAGDQLLWEECVPHPGAAPIRRDYLYLPDGTPFAFREHGKTFWLQTDPRGAVIRAFDAEGNVVWRARYEPFGAARVEVARIRQPLRLPGQYEDEETGLHYNLARYYCPWLKTYLSLDPSWSCLGATNYSYARNDPWNRVDPRGALAFLAVVAVVGGAALLGGAFSAASEYFFGHGDLLSAFVNGAITGAFTAVGGLLGGPWGLVAGGAVGSFFGTLVEGAMRGQGWCWECALRAAATSVFIDLLTMGLGKIPFVKRLFQKAAGQLDDLLRKIGIPMPGGPKPKPDVPEPKPDAPQPKPDAAEPDVPPKPSTKSRGTRTKNRLPEGKNGDLGPPNGRLEKRNPQTDELQQIRYYDENGQPTKDIDFGHDHGAGDPHVHDWERHSPQQPNPSRQDGRPPRPGELDDLDD
jgi:RHS repeat-associated protein